MQPHEDCPLCQQLVSDREWNVYQLRQRVTQIEDEIAAIKQGGRHNDYHESQRASLS